MKFLIICRGLVASGLFILNLFFIPILAILLGFSAWLIPCQYWKKKTHSWLQSLPVTWSTINSWILHLTTQGKWDIQGPSLDPKAWTLLISNHRSWADILVLAYVFNHRIPLLKFFLKKELLWTLPIAGLACKAVGFPFMERHTRQQLRKNPALRSMDLETSRQACELFKAHPCTVMNFVEGTRFTEEKRERQLSPYQHLLKPKSGGLAVVLSEMQPNIRHIINVTIAYSEDKFSFWEFICGKNTKISVHYESILVTPDLIGDYYQNRLYRAHIQNWLNQIWEAKDELLNKLKRHE